MLRCAVLEVDARRQYVSSSYVGAGCVFFVIRAEESSPKRNVFEPTYDIKYVSKRQCAGSAPHGLPRDFFNARDRKGLQEAAKKRLHQAEEGALLLMMVLLLMYTTVFENPSPRDKISRIVSIITLTRCASTRNDDEDLYG